MQVKIVTKENEVWREREEQRGSLSKEDFEGFDVCGTPRVWSSERNMKEQEQESSLLLQIGCPATSNILAHNPLNLEMEQDRIQENMSINKWHINLESLTYCK